MDSCLFVLEQFDHGRLLLYHLHPRVAVWAVGCHPRMEVEVGLTSLKSSLVLVEGQTASAPPLMVVVIVTLHCHSQCLLGPHHPLMSHWDLPVGLPYHYGLIGLTDDVMTCCLKTCFLGLRSPSFW